METDTDNVTEEQIFYANVMVALERIYDLLLIDIINKYNMYDGVELNKSNAGVQIAKKILQDHSQHKYMFPRQPYSEDNE